MTTEDLIPLLEQAGISQEVWFEHHRSIERFAALVAADMIEFMRWVQGSDTELAKQLLAFKTFKKVTEYGHSDDRL